MPSINSPKLDHLNFWDNQRGGPPRGRWHGNRIGGRLYRTVVNSSMLPAASSPPIYICWRRVDCTTSDLLCRRTPPNQQTEQGSLTRSIWNTISVLMKKVKRWCGKPSENCNKPDMRWSQDYEIEGVQCRESADGLARSGLDPKKKQSSAWLGLRQVEKEVCMWWMIVVTLVFPGCLSPFSRLHLEEAMSSIGSVIVSSGAEDHPSLTHANLKRRHGVVFIVSYLQYTRDLGSSPGKISYFLSWKYNTPLKVYITSYFKSFESTSISLCFKCKLFNTFNIISLLPRLSIWWAWVSIEACILNQMYREANRSLVKY